jgi:hypothetical protein
MTSPISRRSLLQSVSGLADHGQSREWLSHGGIPHGLDAFDNGGRTERRAVQLWHPAAGLRPRLIPSVDMTSAVNDHDIEARSQHRMSSHPDFTQELPRKLLPTRAKETQMRRS